MTDRILITTPMECTWPNKNEPVLFLGNWCKLYSRKDVWSEKDSDIVPYHWDNREKLYKDFLYLIDLYELLLEELSDKLNSIHGVNYSLRYWRILVGPWLMAFVPVFYDRWSSLEKAASSYNISKTFVIDYSDLESIPQDHSHFEHLVKSDQWNHFIYSSILKKTKSVRRINIEKKYISIEQIPKNRADLDKSFSLRGFIIKLASGASKIFAKNNSIFIFESYLRKIDLLKLQLKLFQFPALHSSPKYQNFKADIKARNWKLTNAKVQSSFENILREMIPLQIPTIYIEGYKKLDENSNKLSWPKNPKLIWTSNGLYTDEVFKIWSAKKTESGTPLLVGQHGGVYGIGLFSITVDHELKLSDYFLSWGSCKWDLNINNEKIIPIGILKKYKKRVEKKSALLVSSDIARYSNIVVSLPMASQWIYANENEFNFISLLPDHIVKDFIIRPFVHQYGWSQSERWRERFPKIKIDSGEKKLEDLFLRSKISISTWNTTTYLETLSLNIPTLMFWDPKYFEIKKSAEKYFDMLKQVGIFHETPQSAANHLIKIWEDIDGWWESSEVVKAKEVFIQRYANNDDLLGKLTKVLKDPDNSMN
jgi:putative transferase (TIGR04331 family)